MTLAELLKSGIGIIEGVGKSKKLGLTTAFVAICLGLVSSAPTPLERIASLAAATVAVIVYVLGQSRVESKAAELITIDEAVGSSTSEVAKQ